MNGVDQVIWTLLTVLNLTLFALSLLIYRQAQRLRANVEEIDRNARAYGYDVGRGRGLHEQMHASSDNPFLDPQWRDRVVKGGPR